MKYSLFFVLLSTFTFVRSQEIPPKDWQIQTAVLAAPEEFRAEATVMGYSPDGDLTILRKGSNNMVCLADDPNKKGFSVSAYHEELEPYMKRGRELRAEGKEYMEVFNTREEEVKSGQLKMPDRSTLFVLSGTVDPSTSEVTDRYLRYVVYIPYATAASTGLPESPPGPGGPWIMDPGTHRAHIMISPPKN